MKHISQLILLLTAWLLAAGSANPQPAPARSAGAGQTLSKGQDYPTRPVRLIIPFGPGGATDFAARILQASVSQDLGQPIVIDNRPGAGGNIGVEHAARANPDGHTILLGNVGTMAINPSIYPKFPISPLRDFTGITLITEAPGALAVHPSVGETVEEFIKYAKARPAQLNYSSTSPGAAQRLAFEFFMGKAGIKLANITYKAGGGAVVGAVISGEVSATMLTVISLMPHLKAGKLRVLAVVAPKRISQLPDTPTMGEVGFPELTLGSWQGMWVPAGTPRAIVNRLYSVFVEALRNPEVAKRLNAGGAEVLASKSPEEFATFLKSQNEFWAKIVKQTGATAQ